MVNLDNIIMSSLTGQYINYETLERDITIGGSLANGATALFTTTFEFSKSNSRADTYYTRTSSGRRSLLNAGTRVNPNVYTFVSTEVVETVLRYRDSTITAGFSITNNTGGSINLVAQTMSMQAVIYNAPLGNIT
jgi:hypothetical protein